MTDKNIIVGVAVLLLAVGGILYATSSDVTMVGTGTTPGSNEPVDMSTPPAQLAQCLKDKGVVFYGAFWCPHCQSQKAMFGAAAKLLPYVECSTPDQKGQYQVCINKNVQSYPTWDFPDGSRMTGEVSFAKLAEKSGCADPANSGAPVIDTITEATGTPALIP